jgi:hypothetical protein
MQTIAITDADGNLRFVQFEGDVRNVITFDGARYKGTGTVTHEGQHVPVYRITQKPVQTRGNCPRCGGTGNYGSLGVCFACSGTGKRA